ncbi:MAG TPA: 8-oxo-dGTP diphosphatase [Bacillota bacterium]|nr:8-oxo-dGTP diphosphatase [Bacillota bacterium]
MTSIETVSIIYQHPRILLGMKKRGFGADMYNGFGGKTEANESLIKCAIRETKEETEITMINPIRMGNILFHFQSEEPDHNVHFFKASLYTGKLKESEEMKFRWFHINKIPYNQMWPDDEYWMPLLLNGKFFRGEFEFNLEGKIAKYELNEVSRLD